MKRREFITLVGGAAATWPIVAGAQQAGRMRQVGILFPPPESDTETQTNIAAFKLALAELGWSEGINIRFEIRLGAADAERRSALAKDLVALPADVLFCTGTPVTAALLNETRDIPIVFVNASDPIGSGFAASLAHPGGNVTGFTNFEASVAQKWLELLLEISPSLKRVGVLFNPETAVNAGQYFFKPIEVAARTRNIEPLAMPVRSAAEIVGAVAILAKDSGSGLIALPDAFLNAQRALVPSLAIRHLLPAVYGNLAYPRLGGLMSYAPDRIEHTRGAASYVDRILKGEKPGDLPIQAPVKFELVINLKTAKAIGLEVPWFLQQRADEVIE